MCELVVCSVCSVLNHRIGFKPYPMIQNRISNQNINQNQQNINYLFITRFPFGKSIQILYICLIQHRGHATITSKYFRFK